MGIFVGTVIIVGICCLAMSSSLLFSGRPFSGGCGSKPAGSPRCAGCPKGKRHQAAVNEPEGEST